MRVDLISATKSRTKEVHASTNGKMTACRINLTKPENIGQYTTIGEMKDVVEITCDKCKNAIAKQLIREANREMKQMLKAEQKQMKMEDAEMRKNGAMPQRNASPVQPPSSLTSSSGLDNDYTPPSMRRQQETQPIVAPTPPVSAPTPSPVVNSGNDVLSQFAIPAVPTAPQVSVTPAAPTVPQP